MLAPQQQPRVHKEERFARVFLIVVLVATGVMFLYFLWDKLIANKNVTLRLVSIAISASLFFFKLALHLWTGPSDFDGKMKTFGADLGFASISFDVTLALSGQATQGAVHTIIPNPTAFAIVLGVLSLGLWGFFQFPKTVVPSRPDPRHVSIGGVFGVALYFGKLFFYF